MGRTTAPVGPLTRRAEPASTTRSSVRGCWCTSGVCLQALGVTCRFLRMLHRVENAWGGFGMAVRLPLRSNQLPKRRVISHKLEVFLKVNVNAPSADGQMMAASQARSFGPGAHGSARRAGQSGDPAARAAGGGAVVAPVSRTRSGGLEPLPSSCSPPALRSGSW